MPPPWTLPPAIPFGYPTMFDYSAAQPVYGSYDPAQPMYGGYTQPPPTIPQAASNDGWFFDFDSKQIRNYCFQSIAANIRFLYKSFRLPVNN